MTSVRRVLIGMVSAFTLVFLFAGPAAAHTGFESSDPGDGAVLEAPVDEISLVFSGEAEPTGAGFEVLDADGQVRLPSDARSVDGRTWILRFDPPLEDGDVGVRWMVKAPDAHPIDGGFSFTVATPVPVPVPAPDQPSSQPAAGGSSTESPPNDLDSFLSVEAGSSASFERVGAAGRVLGLTGALVGVGALVFAATVLRGERRDIRYVLHWVRRSGLIVVMGAVVELAAQVALEAGTWSGLVPPSAIGSIAWSPFGLAIALRIGGGLALTSGARMHITHASSARDPVATIRELVGVGATGNGQNHAIADPLESDHESAPGSTHAWLASIDSAGAFLGAAALMLSYAFDGHTVTEGNRYLTAAVDIIHVLGGAVWAGGVIMLAAVLWHRHRQGRDLQAAQLAVRFSVVATLALVAVGLAGSVLAFIILDSISELWSTPWGRLLLAKLAIVVVAAGGGAYNHKVLVPRLTTMPDGPDAAAHFRAVVTVEAAALALAIVVTAFLVGAAS